VIRHAFDKNDTETEGTIVDQKYPANCIDRNKYRTGSELDEIRTDYAYEYKNCVKVTESLCIEPNTVQTIRVVTNWQVKRPYLIPMIEVNKNIYQTVVSVMHCFLTRGFWPDKA